MMTSLLDWLDDRTGYRKLRDEALYENIPGGPRWRYIWGSTLAFAIFVQFITGIVLWMHYSPSTQTAWESVYFIEYQLQGGWLLRGIHHYMAQAMIVLLALHLMQVVIDGAYRSPREINFWLGLLLLQVVLGLGLTGYLLPWDQKGYWATQVATKIAGITPLIGEDLKTLIIGGNEYGNLTLTRFFALHAGVLPGILIGLLVLHIAMFRKFGITDKKPHVAPDSHFWPGQVLRESVACLAVFVTVCLLTGLFRAELGAPADPAEAYNAARPEWYYLFLFQFLKFFHGEVGELLGAMVFPGLVFGFMFLMPIIGRWNLGHRFNVLFVVALLLGAASLTGMALYEDFNGRDQKSLQHIAAVDLAEAEGERARELADRGIPTTGALAMLREDPKYAGRKLFARHCSSCHSHVDPDAEVVDPLLHVPAQGEQATASNLFGFGNRDWVSGMLDPERISSGDFFGHTPLAEATMVEWVRDTIGDNSLELEPDELQQAVQTAVIALSAEAGLPGQAELDQQDSEQIQSGRESITSTLSCIDCHVFRGDGDLGMAPELTGYASRQWIIDFISNPHDERFYLPDNYDSPEQMMPSFAPDPDELERNQLTPHELGVLADWLRGDWWKPEESGEPAEQEAE